jgi:hypothetical protein
MQAETPEPGGRYDTNKKGHLVGDGLFVKKINRF